MLIFVLTLAASALVALQPWPMKLLVDHLLGKQPLPGALQSIFGLLGIPSTPTPLLLVITLGILGLFGLNTVLPPAGAWSMTSPKTSLRGCSGVRCSSIAGARSAIR